MSGPEQDVREIARIRQKIDIFLMGNDGENNDINRLGEIVRNLSA